MYKMTKLQNWISSVPKNSQFLFATLLVAQLLLFTFFSSTPLHYLIAFGLLGGGLLFLSFKFKQHTWIQTFNAIFSLGGLAMLIGGMLDTGMWVIECQCCRFAMANSPWIPATEEFLSYSSILMLFCCLPHSAIGNQQKPYSQPRLATHLSRTTLAIFAMFGSMYLVAYVSASRIAQVGDARTILMHGAMVGAMSFAAALVLHCDKSNRLQKVKVKKLS